MFTFIFHGHVHMTEVAIECERQNDKWQWDVFLVSITACSCMSQARKNPSSQNVHMFNSHDVSKVYSRISEITLPVILKLDKWVIKQKIEHLKKKFFTEKAKEFCKRKHASETFRFQFVLW